MKRLLVLLLSVLPSMVMAQDWILQRHITIKDGLPQNSIRDMQYDRYGYLWLATEGGLARWDGQNIRTLTRKDAPKLLESGRISAINSDDKGRLLIRADGRPEKYVAITGPFAFTADTQHLAYSRSYMGPFFNYTPLLASKEIAARPDLQPQIESLFEGRAMTDDGATGVLVLRKSVIWYDGRKVTIRDWQLRDYFFYIDHCLFCIRDKTDLYRVTRDSAYIPIREGSLYKRLLELSADPHWNGDLGIGSYQGPPLAYDGEHVYIVSTKDHIPQLTLLVYELRYPGTIRLLYNEQTGVLAVGTTTDGLFLLQRNNFETCLVTIPPKKVYDHDKNIFYAILPYSNDYIFSSNGLIPLRPDKQYIPFLTESMALGRWKDKYIVSSGASVYMMDSAQRRYAGRLYDGMSGLVQSDALGDSSVFMLHERALFQYSFSTGAHQLIAQCPSGEDEFRCMLQLNDSLIIIGAWRNMFLCNRFTHTLRTIPYFKHINIRRMYRDAQGKIWIGTIGSGLYSWNGDKITHYPVDRNGNLEVINSLKEDSLGYLWVTTNNGLFRYLLKDLQRYENGTSDKLFYNFFDQGNGLMGNEFNNGSPAVIMLRDGRLAFSSMKGIVLADPRHIAFHNAPPSVNVDQVIAGSKTFYSPQGGQLSLPRNAGQIIFRVSSPYSGHPYELQLFYRLSGGDGEWSELPQDGKITFNQLPNGTYSVDFRIVRSGADAYTSFAFTVLPYWYETVWAKTGFGLIILLTGLLLYMLGTRALRRQKARLEVIVSERTEGLNATVTQLNKMISGLRDSEQELYFSQRQREKFSEMVLHDLQSPLKFLSRIADHLYQKITAGNTSGLHELAFDLQQSTRQVTEFSTDYLNWLKTNTGSSQKEREWTDARQIMEKVCTLFTQLARSRNNTLTCNGAAELMLFTIPDYLEIIIRNLVDNANKHTRQGAILIFCGIEDGIKVVRITDTGEGIDEVGLTRINDLFAGREVTVKSDSLGLQIVYGLLTACGGQLKAESVQGKGMTMTISFPDNNDRPAPTQDRPTFRTIS